MERVDEAALAYAYPDGAHVRRHGPAGYSVYESYRPWLEDEFHFRCVYCLNRKVWAPTNIWAIDHLVSQDENPARVCDYENLVFACQFCNQQKGPNHVSDPCRVAYGQCLRVEWDGSVTPLDENGARLIKVIRLNHRRFVEERSKWIRVLHVLAKHDASEFQRLLAYPPNLPDLSALKPPGGNTRPAGVAESALARRESGRLPARY